MEQITSEIKDLIFREILTIRPLEYPENLKDLLATWRNDKATHPIVFIGSGTCGRISGSLKTYYAAKRYFEERNLPAKVIETGCVGLCSEEPLVSIKLPGKNRVVFKKATHDIISDLLDSILHMVVPASQVLGQYREEQSESWKEVPFLDEIDFFRLQTRTVLTECGTINPSSILEYIARGGYQSLIKALQSFTPAQLIDIVEESELRGRGGEGYHTGKKWRIAYNTESNQKYLICNADESDPGAFMDRAIIEGNPHILLESIAIAAYATGIGKVYIYIRNDYHLACDRLLLALNQMKEIGLCGENILDSGFNLNISIRRGAGAFVCGEETALINSLEGKRGIPRTKPPYPAVKGLHSKPTIVNNVETLANIVSIIKFGPEWFKTKGTPGCYGTKLFSISGKVNIQGLVEVPMGTTLQTIIFDICGGIKGNKKLKAIQIGGASGSFLSANDTDTPVVYEELWKKEAIMGSGGMVIMDESVCIVDMTKFFVGFLRNESCGKCIPCREGIQRMLEILNSITSRPKDITTHQTLQRFKGVMQLENLARVIKNTSLCGLGKTAANPVLSALKLFREEFEEHIFERNCRTGVCNNLRLYIIDTNLCTGCNICFQKCPEQAIIGSPKTPHFIIEEKCTGCGICHEHCKFNAINIV